VDRRASHWSQHFKPEALKDRPNTMEVTAGPDTAARDCLLMVHLYTLAASSSLASHSGP